MSKPVLGIVVGAVLGVLDGLSAWLSPDARPMIAAIVVGSTVKGVITGFAAGVIARGKRSMAVGLFAGLLIGLALSALAAVGQGDHYLEIVLPGMLLGAIVGVVTQRYPQKRVGALALVMAFALATSAGAQQPPPVDPFAPLAPMIGRWAGTSEGQPGNGTVERDYERVLGSRFIRVRNRSTYSPQEKNPKGETHEDEGFFSFDRSRRQLVFRQFHTEGFVNTYAQEVDAKAATVSMLSEAIENIPLGYRARETYVFHGPDEIEEVFELAEPGKPFEVYSRTRLKRLR
jgi:hypothetical protein